MVKSIEFITPTHLSKVPENKDLIPLPLIQNWQNSKPQELGVAYVGHNNDGLHFYTYFEDSDLFDTATEDSKILCQFSSVAEFFILPSGTETYWEIHLSPNGFFMDLKIPDNKGFRSQKYNFDDMLNCNSGASYQVQKGDDFWITDITIPWSSFQRKDIPFGETWRFAVCRYNYKGSLDELEYSSTAPLSALNYHLVEDYNTLQF